MQNYLVFKKDDLISGEEICAVSVVMTVCSIVSDHNEVHQSRKARSLVFEIGSQK